MFRRDIEGLRAVAVALVLLNHFGVPGFGGGFIGVDVFFVVSGFLITGLLVREHEDSGTVSLRSFYARRARRLLPASALVIALTALASWFWLEPLRVRSVGSDVLASGGFVANMLFAVRSTDYLQADAAPSPLQHYWSLSVEEQFYLVWPVVLLVLLRFGRGRRAGAVWGIATLSTVSLLLSATQTSASQPWAYFGAHTRVWELGAGALLALAWPIVERIAPVVRAMVGWLGLAVVVAGALVIEPTMLFPGSLALVPVLGTVAALAAGDTLRTGPRQLLGLAPLQWLGARSYSLYLWHWPVLVIAEGYATRSLSAQERFGLLLVAGGGAELSYRLVENPIRRAETMRRVRPALSMGAALVLVSLAAGLFLRVDQPELAAGSEAAAPTLEAPSSSVSDAAGVIPTDDPGDAPRDSVPAGAPGSSVDGQVSPATQPGDRVVADEVRVPVTAAGEPSGPPPDVVSPTEPLAAVVDGLASRSVPSNLSPSLGGASGDKPEIYGNGCHVSMSARRPKLCAYGDSSSNFTVALYGDSHAAQWFDALNTAALNNGWRLLVLTKLGCPPFDEITYNSIVGPTYPACRPWREAALEMMAAERVQVVFVASSNRLLDDSTRQPFSTRVASAAYDRMIGELSERGIAPVLFTDTPYPGVDVPVCLSKAIRRVGRCVPSRSEAIRESRMRVVIDAATRNGAQYLDIEPWVCGPKGCPVIVGNLLVYRDSNHLTTRYVQFLAPLVEAALAPYVNGVRARAS